MEVASEAWFAGDWRVARVVHDLAGARRASFAGRCRFVPDGDGLLSEERGVLRHEGARLAASRRTLWRFPGGGRVAVLYPDGRPFHVFPLAAPHAVHLCGADRYEVAYAFEEGRWFSLWTVRGPRKRYRMLTRYTRCDAPAPAAAVTGRAVRRLSVLGGVFAATALLGLGAGPDGAWAGPPGPKACPPGLANKNPACLPPGQYKKWRRGERIPPGIEWRFLDHTHYQLPPPGEGRAYVRIGRDVYLVAEATRLVIEAINLLDAASR